VLPEGVADTNITGIPSAELTLTEPQPNLQTEDGKVRVVGTTDAEDVVVSFQWRGNLASEKEAPAATTLPVEAGVFRGAFLVPKGRWYLSVAASVDGGYPAVEQIPVKSLNDKMLVQVQAVDGQTRVQLLSPDGEVIDEGVLVKDGQTKSWRVDPDVILRVGNARAANVSVDGQPLGAMGSKPEAKTWRLKQGEKPRTVD
jgi:hypothetical protein